VNGARGKIPATASDAVHPQANSGGFVMDISVAATIGFTTAAAVGIVYLYLSVRKNK
jgi:hypothetical protein